MRFLKKITRITPTTATVIEEAMIIVVGKGVNTDEVAEVDRFSKGTTSG